MKRRFLSGILLAAVTVLTIRAQQTTKPLSKEQVAEFVRLRMETAKLVQLIHDHDIDFEPSDSYLDGLRSLGAPDLVIQTLRDARPKPLTRDQVLSLVAQNISSERAATLVKQRGVDFIPDDAYLENLRLAGATDELVAAIRAGSATRTLPLRGFTREFHDRYHAPVVVFSPDGKVLAAASDRIQAFDAVTGERKFVMTPDVVDAPTGLYPITIALSPDGKLLAAVGEALRGVELWDMPTGSLKQTIPRDALRYFSVAFSPDGSLLAIGTVAGAIKTWDLAAGAWHQTLSPLEQRGKPVGALAFSPDGKVLASGCNGVRLWDTTTGTLLRTISSRGSFCLVFSPDGRLLASADGKVELWDLHTGLPLAPLSGQGREIYSVTFTPDGKLLISGGSGTGIQLWDVATGSMSELVPLTSTMVGSLAVSPYGKILASGLLPGGNSAGQVIMWRLKQY